MQVTPQERLGRILTLVPVIRAHQQATGEGMTIDELAERFGCSRREIHDDLSRILLCGVPPYLPNDYVLVDIEGDRVTIDFAERFARPLSLLVEEALALRLALEGLATDVGLGETARSLRRKLDRLLAERSSEEQEAATRFDAGAGGLERRWMQPLAAAVASAAPVEIDYYTAARDCSTRRIIWPKRFEEQDGVLAVQAHCSLRGGARSFRLDRIRELQSGEDVVERAGEQSEAAVEPSPEPVTVTIRFAPEVARYVRERYADAEIDPESGSATLRLETRAFEWLHGWLLAFGGAAEILSPPAARESYARRLDRVIARHLPS